MNKEKVTLTQDIELPFPCDDIFETLTHQKNYPNTGFEFVSWMATDEDGEDVCMTAMYVILVAQDKLKVDQKKIGTPSKRKMIGGTSSTRGGGGGRDNEDEDENAMM